jgi:hypothetical protein
MSHFYGTLKGEAGPATRRGSKNSGLTTEAASWAGLCSCQLVALGAPLEGQRRPDSPHCRGKHSRQLIPPTGGRRDHASRHMRSRSGANQGYLRVEDRWVLASGLIGILLSLYLWANLSTVSEGMLGFLFGIMLVVEGAALTSLAWRVRREI